MKHRGPLRQKRTVCMRELGRLENHWDSAWLEVGQEGIREEGLLGNAAGSEGQGWLMKDLMCLAMEFRLYPIKRTGTRGVF